MHFSVCTSLGKFVLTIHNYLLLLLLCGVVHILFIIINSKLRLVSANWKPSGKGNSSEILQRLGSSLNPGLVCSWNRPWLESVYWLPCGVAIPMKSLLGLRPSLNLSLLVSGMYWLLTMGPWLLVQDHYWCSVFYQGVSILASKKMVYLTGINWCFGSNLG